jgi:hypothetical protein
MSRGKRATLIAFGLLAAFFAFSYLGRVLHMDCVGPVIYGWGCLAAPMPDTIVEASAGSYRILVWLGIAGGFWLVSYLAADMLLPIVAAVMRKVRPGWIENASKEPPRSYRLR